MFDPTIFENLKVGIENAVYDLDNLDEIIRVTDRKDLWIWPRYPEASTSGSSWRRHPQLQPKFAWRPDSGIWPLRS